VVDFWRLVWQEKVQTIVMLNSSAEGKLKRSEIYWPEVGTRELGPFMVTLVECQVFADYIIRTVQLVVSGLELTVSD
jgi:protein tyrosine phosphatase